MEKGDVGAAGEFYYEFAVVGVVVIVLHEALADLTGGDADNRICIGVIAWGAAEDFNADTALLELDGIALRVCSTV
jgi:hypothetical protein